MSELDYNSTPASNTTINGIGIAGTNSPANFDNALRQLMADRADVIAGTVPWKDTFTLADPADTTKRFRFDGGNITASNTRVLTIPDNDATLGNIPATNDGAALGSASKSWSDLFLASGGVINWNNGDVTITHSSNALAFAGASSGYTFDAALSIGTSAAFTAGSIELGHASDNTLTAASGVLSIEGKRILDVSTQNQPVTGGATITSLALNSGNPVTSGTLTLDVGDCPLQHYTANGAHTLAPGSVTGAITLDVTMGASASTITTSGFTKVVGAFTYTSGHKFRCHASVGNAGSLLIIQEFQ